MAFRYFKEKQTFGLLKKDTISIKIKFTSFAILFWLKL